MERKYNMQFIYGMLVSVTCTLPDMSIFYQCKNSGRLVGYLSSSKEYLVIFDGCASNPDIPFTGFDRGWYPDSCLVHLKK
jgi:hypothetical protein